VSESHHGSETVTQGKYGPNFFLRALWYIFIGWWLTGISLAVGYLAGLTVIGLPIAFWIFNRTGTLLTLRPRSQTTRVVETGGTTTVSHQNATQRPLLLRAIWFVLVGWWAALIWMVVSYLISLTIIGIPIGIMMLNRLPGVFTLHRN
jgi:uncharacterized membrane protein YccF (DUF307 family)